MVSAFVRRSVLLFAFVGCDLPAAEAQTSNATLHGTVADSSGAVLPGVTVKLLAPATGLTRDVITNPAGVYVFNFLPSGEYEITAELAGFKSVRRADIRLEIGQSLGLDLKMEVGQSPKSSTWKPSRRSSIGRPPRSERSFRPAS